MTYSSLNCIAGAALALTLSHSMDRYDAYSFLRRMRQAKQSLHLAYSGLPPWLVRRTSDNEHQFVAIASGSPAFAGCSPAIHASSQLTAVVSM